MNARRKVYTETLLFKVREEIADPMWADHAEVSKELLREVVLALQDLRDFEDKAK